MSLRKRFSIREVPQLAAGPLAAFMMDVKRAMDAVGNEAVTVSDLVSAGLVSQGENGNIIQYQPSVMPPPAPSSLTVTTGVGTVFLEFGGTVFPGFAYAQILRSTTNTFASAQVIGTALYSFYPDPVGVDSPTYYYWVRYVNTNGVVGQPNSQTGTAATTKLVDTAQIVDSAIKAAKLDANSVTTVKIVDDAIAAAKLQTNSVTTTKIAALAVTNAKIDALAVDAAKIANLAVTNAKIDNLAVDAAKIAALAVTNAKIDNLAVTTAKIDNLAITNGKIANLAVDSAKISGMTVDKLLAGTIAVGQYIQSQGYVPGSAGWKIHADGTAEFSGVTVRGTIYATAGYLQGVEIRNSDGTVIMSSGGTLKADYGVNMVFESMPALGTIGGFKMGTTAGANGPHPSYSPWYPTGYGGVYVVHPSVPGAGSVTAIYSADFPVVAGKRYEASCYLSAHRCVAQVRISWYDINGTYISDSTGGLVTTAGQGDLVNWERSYVFAVAPANAVSANVGSLATYDGVQNNPYMFQSMVFMAPALASQTVPSPWVEGQIARRITSANVSTYIKDLAVDTLQIANQAVSIPVSAFISGQGNVAANDTAMYDLVGVGVTSTGAPATLTFSWTCSQNAPSHLSVRAYVDSTPIFFEYIQAPGLQSVTIGVQLSAGYHYLKMNIKSGDAGNYADYWVRNRAVVYVETKK